MGDFARAYEYVKDSLGPKRIVVEYPPAIKLNETTIKKIDGYTIRKDQPHTGGDEYHAHCRLGGYEVCWMASGRRRHPNKFPADSKIPNDVKNAIADVLGISVNMLECWHSRGEDEYVVTIHEVKSPGTNTGRIPEDD